MVLQKFKITLVYPDFESLGVEYLMAVSLKAGHKVEFVSFRAEHAYLGIKEKHLSFGKVAKRIAESKPDLAVFSCVTDNYQYQLGCARALKKINPKIKTVFGGIHPTVVPKKVLEEAAVDAVAIGEAEISFVEFLDKCKRKNQEVVFPERKVKGIVFKKKGKVQGEFKEGELADLNKLPFPHKDPFFKALKEFRYRYIIMTSRGCPFSCSYCFNSFVHKMRGKRIIRRRSVKNVIDELLWAKDKYKFKVIYFIDDCFTVDKKWLGEFLKVYKRKIGLPFACLAHPNCVDKEIAERLGKAGCIFITIGVQSVSCELSKKVLDRVIDKKKIMEAISALKKAGVMVQADHILGIPGDTIKNQEEAILFYNELRPDLVSVFWLTFYPKIPIIKTAVQKGMLSQEDIDKIEKGLKFTKGSFHDGGSMKDPGPYFSVQLLLNYLPFLPKWLVRLLVERRWYRYFKIRNFYVSTALPRMMQGFFDKRYFWGRSMLISFLDRMEKNIFKD